MSRSVYLLLLGMVALHAQEIAPASPKATQGKILYVPIMKPVDFYEEVRIQKEDQNSTKLGGAK